MIDERNLPQEGNVYFYHLVHNHGLTKCICFIIGFENGEEKYHFAYRNNITLTDVINHHIIKKKDFVLSEGNLIRVINKEKDSDEKIIMYESTNENERERKMYGLLDKLLRRAGL